jgi:3-methyladenine DNA glycosylase/8-oxoguanine DNA glycosylase
MTDRIGFTPTPVDGTSSLPFEVDAARAHLAAADRKLARLMDRVGPFRLQLKETRSTFGALAEAIVYQQLTGKAAATIFGRVTALYPAGRFGAARVLATPDARLRACGLSGAKLAALKDLAAKAESRVVPPLRRLHAMDDAAIVEHLTAVRGIGRWTVEMLLIFRLGRPDVLPVDDYGVRKGFAIAFGGDLPAPRDVAARGERWRPYRTMAAWYLWRAVDSPEKKP